ncbi:MAG: hypothetical protein NVSMB29_00540 [Candidatus Dormibacteria bacterium]
MLDVPNHRRDVSRLGEPVVKHPNTGADDIDRVWGEISDVVHRQVEQAVEPRRLEVNRQCGHHPRRHEVHVPSRLAADHNYAMGRGRRSRSAIEHGERLLKAELHHLLRSGRDRFPKTCPSGGYRHVVIGPHKLAERR